MAPPKKSKSGRTKGAGQSRSDDQAEPRKTIASFKGSDAFDEWFKGLVKKARMPTSTVIEHGLICLAKELGYDAEPPER